jgi:DNA-directed RNA polymerase subunit beta'
LGEAIGIIAAQSIGEPGTQLTMRTFHTGGVFTGEVAEQLRAPFDGVLRLPKSVRTRLIRTRHGEEALLVEEGIQLDLYNYQAIRSKLEVKQGSILFLSDNEQFKTNQVIAEMSTRGNAITERVTKDLSTEISGEVYFADLSVEEKIDRQGNTMSTTAQGGLLWILSGDVYTVPTSSKIVLEEGNFVKKQDVLAITEVQSDYGGVVRLSHQSEASIDEIQIVTSSVILNNATIKPTSSDINSDLPYSLALNNKDIFLLHCSPGNKLSDSQIIAELIDTKYTTQTGGIIRYHNIVFFDSEEEKESYPTVKNGSIFWIPEETHEINKDIALLSISEGKFVSAGTELIKDLYSTIEGYIYINQENGIVHDVIIKSGFLIPLKESDIGLFSKDGKLILAGEEIYSGIYTEENVFVEPLTDVLSNSILVRPVIEYKIEEDCKELNQTCLSDIDQSISLKLVKRLPFQDGEKIQSIKGVELLKTYIILETESTVSHLSADIEFLPILNTEYCQLRLVVLENLSITQDPFGEINKDITFTNFLVHDGDRITAGTVVAQTQLLSRSDGQVKTISVTNNSSRKLLLCNSIHEKRIQLDGLTPQVATGDLVRAGDQIAENIIASNSGQVVELGKDNITIRAGYPYLISAGAILQVNNKDLLQRGDILAILVFERSKTGDIVQGLPRIEEILEARKPKEACKLAQRPGIVHVSYDNEDHNNIKIIESNDLITEYLINPVQKIIVSNGETISLSASITDGAPNPHEMLAIFFGFYKSIVTLYDAAKFSLQKVQLYLVNEVQNVYQSQNVDISDKHIEVIVRQMTSKVRVEDGGDTTLLPGELVELQQIDNINEAMTLTKGMPATYSPVLLGITKASLNTDSFISAASFQETTRVLTEAAIEGKADWLRGLKENVIIGRLIPAGTGFNAYLDSSRSINGDKQSDLSYNYYLNPENNEQSKDLEDFILDDNIARNYKLLDNKGQNFAKIKEDFTS